MNKFLKLSAISGIILIILSFLTILITIYYSISEGFFNFLLLIFTSKSIALNFFLSTIFFSYSILFTIEMIGFIIISKKIKSKFLFNNSVFAIILGIFLILICSLMVISGIYVIISHQQLEDFGGPGLFVGIITIHILYSLIYGIYSIIFGISLLKLKNKFKESYSAGIFNIIAGLTYFFLIGNFFKLIARIFEVNILNEFAKK